MRSVCLLASALLLAGCLGGLQDLTADCGERQEVRLGPDPWLSPPAEAIDGRSFDVVWMLDSPTKACVDQHARYTVSATLSPAEAGCSPPDGVLVGEQVGFTGHSESITGEETTYHKNGELGVRAFDEPQWLFLELIISFPDQGSARNEECVRAVVSSVEMTLSYLEPPTEG